MKKLILGDLYSRKDVHRIFSPDTIFTPQSGTWGIQGIIPIPNRESDYVFFVSYGKKQGLHTFDEGISPEGVLSWQSQPRQTLKDNCIKQLINHDESQSNIYLFLRTQTRRLDYTFYGRLKYLTHDISREQPVHFQWQLLNWDDLKNKKTLVNYPESSTPEGSSERQNCLEESKIPTTKPRKQGTNTQDFQNRKKPDYAERDERNRQLGTHGELLVMKHEKERLTEVGRSDLSDKVLHVSVIEGDGAGYDILSFNNDGSKRFIEVKTTRGDANTDFFMSKNEVKFANHAGKSYYLYRLYNYDSKNNTANFFIIQGTVEGKLYNLEPMIYKVSLRS